MIGPTVTWNPVRGCSNGRPRWTGKVDLVEKHLEDPLRWKTPRRVFVNSMSDLFHEALLDEAIDRVFAVMAVCPQHTFEVLTKRSERMREWLTRDNIPDMLDVEIHAMGIRSRPEFQWPLPNVWLGVSVEDQATADERIPLLLRTPAALRFVSYEPALGPVNLLRYMSVPLAEIDNPGAMLDWVIVGGESGPGARPFDIPWARNTVAQCKAAGVACFVKQVGSVPMERGERWRYEPKLKDRKGGDWEEWPADLRVREFPKVQTYPHCATEAVSCLKVRTRETRG